MISVTFASQIYLALEHLEKKQYVACELVEQTGKPNKKLYSLTEAGREEFLRWLSSPEENAAAGFKSAFLMKLFFSGNAEPEQGCALLRRFISDCRAFMDSMITVPDGIIEHDQTIPAYSALYWQFTADFGRSYLTMCIEWAENCLQRLEEL